MQKYFGVTKSTNGEAGFFPTSPFVLLYNVYLLSLSVYPIFLANTAASISFLY